MSLERFIEAQERMYDYAFSEMEKGCKRTHWIWFIFPQIKGLGQSATSEFFAIENLEEAKEYLAHPILGARLREITKAVLSHKDKTAYEIFHSPDDMKFRSSMTLFYMAGGEQIFLDAINTFYNGIKDRRTMELIGM